ETAALYAAASAAATTGTIAVALTSAGPGFLAAMQGAAGAATVEAPVLYLAGASPVAQRGHGAFQEVDQARIAGAVCKGSFEIGRAEDARRITIEAARLARAGVPGPAHVAMPNDVLTARITGEEAALATADVTAMQPEQRAALLA
ncbi:MAG TPA: thiamine pyrophosphate-binding protein, partial [Chloroflexi bacterium]|nr:thiamine pyrophosphate-binding protein [Chloroflexota bacterium]